MVAPELNAAHEPYVAITGSTGFVGQAVLDTAEREGQGVRALTRRPPDRDRSGVHWVRGSLSDTASLEQLAQGTEAVIHIAGLTSTIEPSEFEAANVTGTANVIAAMRAAGVKRLVFVSSLAAREPQLSAYGASKAAAEELVEKSGLDWMIVRPPAVYGPRDSDMFELFRAAKWGLVPLPPGGATSIIHVDDLARLLLALVVAPPELVRRRFFEPDDGREGGWSHKELAKEIGKAMGRRVFAPHLPARVLAGAARFDRLVRGRGSKLTTDRVGYMCHPNWVVRSDKAVPQSVWSPRMSGEDGLARAAAWYRAEGWL
ncbi:MAG: NAD-dependent epimerase/dehydratase family protein [Qipengyuania sp.]